MRKAKGIRVQTNRGRRGAEGLGERSLRGMSVFSNTLLEFLLVL